MKQLLRKNIIALCAVLVLCGLCAAAVLLHGHTAPSDVLLKEPGQLAYTKAADVKLADGMENTNLSNAITQKEKQRREETKEQEKGKAHTAGENPADNRENETDSPENQNPSEEQNPSENQGGEGQEDYEDLPEDAYVEETIPVDDLLKEIGIDDPNQIIYVKAVTGDGKSQLLKLVNGVYSAFLSTQGTTIIQIKYTDDDGQTKTFTKKITYKRPENATPEKKRPLIQTSLKDQATYSNQVLNFDVWVTNYRGKPLAYNNLEVFINGKKADYVGEMGRQTYRVNLKVGANEIKIKVTDTYQYTVTKVYDVYYKSGKATVTISLEAGTIGLKYLIAPQKVKVESGTPLSKVIDEFLTANGCTYGYSGSLDQGFYLAQVKRKDLIKGFKIPKSLIEKLREDEQIFSENDYESLDTLGERDFAQFSGWMYSINGVYASYGLDKAYVENGDVVRIRFTLALGKDIGSGADGYGPLTSYGKEW